MSEQRLLNAANGRAGTGSAVPADHDQVGPDGIAGQRVGRMVTYHVGQDRHVWIFVPPRPQRFGQARTGLRRDVLGVDLLPCGVPDAGVTTACGGGPVAALDRDEGGAAPGGLIEGECQGGA
jgi:hypothetical protein